jgi:hypothetical protein
VRGEGDASSRRNGQQAQQALDELEPLRQRARAVDNRDRPSLDQRSEQALNGRDRVLAVEEQVEQGVRLFFASRRVRVA